ncbi:hypothetical protein ACWEOI_01060 [Nocardia sp. NPDC004340]
MRGRRINAQLQGSFDFMLSRILSGGGFLSGSGLDEETMTALEAIAEARPNVPDDLVAAARTAFAGQLDGSNAERWLAERDRVLAAREEQSKRSEQHRAGLDAGASPWEDHDAAPYEGDGDSRHRNEILAEGNRLDQLYRSIGATPQGNEAFSSSGELRRRYREWLPEIPVARGPFTGELTNLDLLGNRRMQMIKRGVVRLWGTTA